MKTSITLATLLLMVAQTNSDAAYELKEHCPGGSCRWFEKNNTFSCSLKKCKDIPKLGSIEKHIEQLYLDRNVITAVGILDYPELKLLELDDNEIVHIQDGAFEKCRKLETLNLSGNRLTNISSGAFRNIDSLRNLYLARNQITYLSSEMFNWDMQFNVIRLDFSENLIDYIEDDSFKNLNRLKYLHLGNNEIKNIRERTFMGLFWLEHLALDKNLLSELKNNTFKNLDALLYLDLSYNIIGSIEPLAFDGLDFLAVLNLEANKIQSLEGIFTIGLLERLANLHLDYNLLERVEQQVLPPKLKTLSMSNMDTLWKIDTQAFGALKYLETIHISENPNLVDIAEDAFHPNATIRNLNLADNKLRTLGGSIIDWLKINQVDLSGNPWHCDCHISWMTNVFLEDETSANLRCATPRHLSNKLIADLGFPDMVCQKTYIYHLPLTFALIGLTTFIMLATVLFLCFKCRRYLLPCFYNKQFKYLALYDVNDDGDEVVNIHMQGEKRRSSIVKRRRNSAPDPVAV